ncbi:C4-dicarboxylate transporter/malic acid transport protein [Streptomyces sp. 2224.1]|nr:C4-dicarboxylate transporter/malic acid transport protein [Streptomyces sp. 2321.6]SDR55021.1 C4-dicarboxylate transporter/malic acid transport protein [Streptomyces sp. KS_16]SEC15322.1 C4-dicarboxylate transporter/malic acid transport protein [Streptomyces sp. 2133.1]SED15925.1 C4-dicarboxylate transporter/malic acid transport protein [Streptomyces sp. 2224.1]SEF07845.1 C4-dicarboxylate transporter/malic acid transport protein [Streptomyces sp. 2112.3]SNC65400.1 C4-dicarboxylate transport
MAAVPGADAVVMASLAQAPSRPGTAAGTGPGTRPGTPDTAPSVRHLGPNWYAAVMGTAIVANAGTVLPLTAPGLHTALQVVWALSALMLLTLLAARAVHWARHGDQARTHLLDPAVAPFYGCLAMALLAVGGGTLAVGRDVLGEPAAVAADATLWILGTLVGLTCAAGIPYLMVARHRIEPGSASPVWLLPLVAPMVSAALGPALVPYLPAGQWRAALLFACYALFGMSLLATLLVLPLVLSRLIHHGPLPLALTPTLFLVLGPLGQSTTAVANLAHAAPGVVDSSSAHAMGAFAVLYGVPVMGFALLWLAIATALVVRAVRNGMGFAMTWWGFTFPLGTCVTGAVGLARRTGLTAFDWLAVGLFALLVTAVAVAATRTAAGLAHGRLLAPPRPVAS